MEKNWHVIKTFNATNTKCALKLNSLFPNIFLKTLFPRVQPNPCKNLINWLQTPYCITLVCEHIRFILLSVLELLFKYHLTLPLSLSHTLSSVSVCLQFAFSDWKCMIVYPRGLCAGCSIERAKALPQNLYNPMLNWSHFRNS